MYEAQVFARVVPCSVKPKKRSNIDIRYQAINSKIQTRSGGVGVQNFVAWDSCPGQTHPQLTRRRPIGMGAPLVPTIRVHSN